MQGLGTYEDLSSNGQFEQAQKDSQTLNASADYQLDDRMAQHPSVQVNLGGSEACTVIAAQHSKGR